MEWQTVGEKRMKREGAKEWDRRLAAAASAAMATTTPKRRQPGDRRRTEWFCATHGCGISNWMTSTSCRQCTAGRSPECQVVPGWEDNKPGPAAGGAGGQPPCPTTRATGAVAGAAGAAPQPRKVWPSPVRPANTGGNTSAVAKTPLARARVTLELAVAAAYPQAVLDTMQEHIASLEAEERQRKPLGQRIDQARKRLRAAENECDKAEKACAVAAAAKIRCAEEAAAAATALEVVISEAAAEPGTTEAEHPDVAMANALQRMLEMTERTWPNERGAPPERLIAAMQAGAAALAKQRSNTPPRAAELRSVEDQDDDVEIVPRTLEQLEADLKSAQSGYVEAIAAGHPDAADPMRVRVLADISEQVAIARRLQFSPKTPAPLLAPPLVGAHADLRYSPC